MSAYSTLILSHANLLSYWRLGEVAGSAVDSKGAVTGTYGAGSVTRGVPSLLTSDTVDLAVQTDRTGPGNVKFGNVYEFLGTAHFGVELWLKPTDVSALVQTVVGTIAASAGSGWALEAWNGGTRIRRYDSTPSFNSATRGALVQDVVSYVASGTTART